MMTMTWQRNGKNAGVAGWQQRTKSAVAAVGSAGGLQMEPDFLDGGGEQGDTALSFGSDMKMVPAYSKAAKAPSPLSLCRRTPKKNRKASSFPSLI